MNIQAFRTIRILTFSILLFVNLQSYAQPWYSTKWEIDYELDSTQIYDFRARDYIQLLPGFEYKAIAETTLVVKSDPFITTTSFSGIIEEDRVYNVTYNTPYDKPEFLNPLLPVGSTPYNIRISESGASTCQIPIQVPPGSGGLSPDIAVTYNSQSGLGLLGMGWNLAGISAITRAGRTIYHNGVTEGVDLTSGDQFTLDGNRLIAVSGTYGSSGTEYRTELQIFVKIISSGTAGNGPQSFMVCTKNGDTLEFGTTTDSRIEAQGKSTVLVWNISKIKDSHGNSITFSYEENNQKGEHWLKEVNYSGNKISFIYESAPKMANVSFVGGSKITQSHVLGQIRTYTAGNLTKEYYFRYRESFNIHLDEVIEYGYDRSRLNSTQIKWGVEPEDVTPTSTVSVSPFEKHVFGDFNGDGKTDMFTYPDKISYSSSDTWNLWINNGYSFDVPSYKGNFNDSSFSVSGNGYKILGLQTQDIDGDGKEDLLFSEKADKSVCTSCIDDHVVKLIPYLSTGNGFSPAPFPSTPVAYHKEWGRYIPGDFDGDGLMDIFTYDLSNFKWQIHFLKKDQVEEGMLPLGVSAFTAADVDGDGRNEILVVEFYQNNGNNHIGTIRLLEYNQTTTLLSAMYTSTSGDFDDFENFIPGDFNGDGKTDLILDPVYVPDVNWPMVYFDGLTFRKDLSTFPYGTYIQDINRKRLIPGDFNGDGKCDILQFHTGGSAQNPVATINMLYSRGVGFERKSDAYQLSQNIDADEFIPGDFNGDGRMDLFHVDRQTGKGTRLLFNQGINPDLVHSISNGSGFEHNFTYQPITESTIYQKSAGSFFPLMDYQGPIYVTETVKESDGAGGAQLTRYTYGGAKLHRQGKGFLGFLYREETNITTDRRLNWVNEIDAFYNNRPVDFYVGTFSALTLGISETHYTNDIKDYGQKINFPFASEIAENDLVSNHHTVSSFSYDNFGNVIAQTVDQGSETTVTSIPTYIAAGSWCLSKPASVTVTTTRDGETPYARQISYTYNTATGKPLTMIMDPSKSKSVTHTYAFDSFGNLIKDSVSATGLTSRKNSYGYDALGRYNISEANAAGHTRTLTRDPRDGNVLTETDENGNTTTHQYDGWARIKHSIMPTGATMDYSYEWFTSGGHPNGINKIVKTGTGMAPISEHFDVLGRMVRLETIGFDGSPIISDKTYNNRRQLISETRPYGSLQTPQLTTYIYDDIGRLDLEKSPETTIDYSYADSTITIHNIGAGQTTSRTTDATGKVTETTDAAGTTEYAYHSCGEPKTITPPDGEVISMVYDEYGLQAELTDPNAGVMTYAYNAYGELTSQTDAKSQVYTLSYDVLGRMISKTGPEGTYSWNYDTQTNGIGLLAVAYGPDGYAGYYYDSLSRVIQITENTGIKAFSTEYKYNAQNQVTDQIYPADFHIVNTYNANGFLSEVKEAGALLPIWKGMEQNAWGQWTQYLYGNAQVVNRSYDQHGFPLTYTSNAASASTGSPLINLHYQFHAATGNLVSRSDANNGLTETFTYDNLDRLTGILSPGAPSVLSYEPSGNIFSRTLVGEYTYGAGSAGPHAVTRINNTGIPALPAAIQQITYNPFNKIESMEEGDYNMEFFYGPDQERRKADLYDNGTLIKTKYYSINFESIETPGGNMRYVSYIPGGDGLAAIYVTDDSGGSQLYYVHTDYLGSILLITDDLGVPVETYSYDAWGRRRDPVTWTYNDILPVTDPVTDRGYTGHEHMELFGLINMNGRLYDPVVGRMLSPDNESGHFGSSQGYNRYSYAMNNPLKYTDPDGDNPIVFLLAGVIGGGMNLYSNWHKVKDFSTGFAYFASGAIGGAMSVVSPVGGGAFTATANFAIDIATGNVPTMNKPIDAVKYFGGLALDGLAAGGAGSLANWATGWKYSQTFTQEGVKHLVNPELGLAGGVQLPAYTVTLTKTPVKSIVANGIKGGKTVLGKYPKYLSTAQELGANRFKIPSNVWNKMSPAKQWATNQKFLDRAIARGDEFILSNKVLDINKVSGSFRKELEYLLQNGFKLVDGGTRLVR